MVSKPTRLVILTQLIILELATTRMITRTTLTTRTQTVQIVRNILTLY